MQHGLPQKQAWRVFRPLPGGGRIGLIAVTLIIGGSALPSSGAEPAPKPEPKQAQAERREYLSTVLRKALLENERTDVSALANFHKLYKAWQEAGDASTGEVDEVEQELLRARIRVLERETDYRDAVDQFKLRFGLAPERIQQMEEAAILPLVRHIQRFDDILKDHDKGRSELSGTPDPEKASKVRSLLYRFLTGSALVKDTKFGKQFAAQWAEWEKLKDVAGSLRKYKADRRLLLDRREEFEAKGQTYPQAILQRLEEIELGIDVGKLEWSLRAYESQPWKAEKDEARRRGLHQTALQELRGVFEIVLYRVLQDSLARHQEKWPEPAPVRLEGVNLLTCGLEKAERLAASASKKPDAAVARKMRVREVRTLAESHRIQRRLFEISLLQVQNTLDMFRPSMSSEALRAADAIILTKRLLTAQRSLAGVKGQLFSSWVNYQIAREELYRVLELTPP